MGEVSPFNKMNERYADKGFEFLTVYVREPHPGENYTEHRTWEQKVDYARRSREQDGIQTKLVIDDLEGTMHRAYGEMPNMVYVIDKNGRVFYRAMWTNHEEIESVLETLLLIDQAAAEGRRVMPFYNERMSLRAGYNSGAGARVLERAGPKAAKDFQEALGMPRP